MKKLIIFTMFLLLYMGSVNSQVFVSFKDIGGKTSAIDPVLTDQIYYTYSFIGDALLLNCSIEIDGVESGTNITNNNTETVGFINATYTPGSHRAIINCSNVTAGTSNFSDTRVFRFWQGGLIDVYPVRNATLEVFRGFLGVALLAPEFGGPIFAVIIIALIGVLMLLLVFAFFAILGVIGTGVKKMIFKTTGSFKVTKFRKG